jgi:hypothetical protein
MPIFICSIRIEESDFLKITQEALEVPDELRFFKGSEALEVYV